MNELLDTTPSTEETTATPTEETKEVELSSDQKLDQTVDDIFEKAYEETEELEESPQAPTESVAQKPGEVTQETTQTQTTEDPTSQKVDPLQHWPEDVKAEISKVSPKALQFYIDRHKDFDRAWTKKVEPIAPFLHAEKTISPYLNRIQVPFFDFINDASQLDYSFRFGTPEQKATAANYIADAYQLPDIFRYGFQIDHDLKNGDYPTQIKAMKQIAKLYSVGEKNKEVDPRLEEVTKKQNQIEKYINQEAQQRQQQQQAQQQRRVQDNRKIWNNFVEAKDEQGNHLHPYANELLKPMLALLDMFVKDGKQPPSMEELYQRAAYSDPCLLYTSPSPRDS